MAAHEIDARIEMQLLLALATGDGGEDFGKLETRARALGLTGAEIDAARAGRCFDVRAAAAVAYATALRKADIPRIQAAHARVQRLGFGLLDVEAIERLSRAGARTDGDGNLDHA